MSTRQLDLRFIVDEIVEGSDGIGAARAGIRRRRRLAAADVANLEPEAIAAANGTGIRDQSHELGVGRRYRRSAERAGLLRVEPRVDAGQVEGVAAERQQAELIVVLEFRQANGAVGCDDGGGGATLDGGESEDRE